MSCPRHKQLGQGISIRASAQPSSKRRQRSRAGVSLLETTVYIFGAGVVLTTCASLLHHVFRLQHEAAVSYGGYFAFERLTATLREDAHQANNADFSNHELQMKWQEQTGGEIMVTYRLTEQSIERMERDGDGKLVRYERFPTNIYGWSLTRMSESLVRLDLSRPWGTYSLWLRLGRNTRGSLERAKVSP